MPNSRRLYRTRLFDADGHWAWPPPYRARSWQGELRFLTFTGNPEKIYNSKELPESVRRFDPPRSFVVSMDAITKKKPTPSRNGNRRFEFVPEVMISAPDRASAQIAANTILAGLCVQEGHLVLDRLIALPDAGKPLEDLDDLEYEACKGRALQMAGLGRACAIGAKASLRKAWNDAIARLYVSYHTYSVHYMDTHPRYGEQFGIEADPIKRAVLSQSIVSAYAAIEALGLEVRASQKNPSKLPGGEWNPSVLGDLEDRLRSSHINLEENFLWNVRNTPTRIERRYSIPAGKRAEWARGHIRDRHLSVADSLHRASLIRSKIAAHGGAQLAKSITIYDVCNMQNLARRLFLETVGFWRGPYTAKRPH